MASCTTPLLSNQYQDENIQIQIDIGRDKLSLLLSTKLGEGAFGSVYKAQDERGKYFAVKKIACQDDQSYYAIAQEIQILTELKNDYLVQMYAFDFIDSTAIVVMEYCDGGTLNSCLSEKIVEERKLNWMTQLTQGLIYLHGKNIVHRDLKTENILLKSNNTIKISDFGISRQFICIRGNNYDRDDAGFISEYLNAYMGTFAGTPFWVAPEVFDLKYNESADIFSLGAIFYSILEQKYCKFDGKNYYGVFVKHGGQDVGIGLAMSERGAQIMPDFDKTKNILLKNMICNMLCYNPRERASLVDTLNGISGVYEETIKEEYNFLKEIAEKDSDDEHIQQDDNDTTWNEALLQDDNDNRNDECQGCFSIWV